MGRIEKKRREERAQTLACSMEASCCFIAAALAADTGGALCVCPRPLSPAEEMGIGTTAERVSAAPCAGTAAGEGPIAAFCRM